MQKQEIPNTNSSTDVFKSYLENSKLSDYLNKETGRAVKEILGNEGDFKRLLSKFFHVPEDNVYESIRPFFEFSRRCVKDLFDSIQGGEELHGPYHNRIFNADQVGNIFEFAKYALIKLPRELIRYKLTKPNSGEVNTFSGGEINTLRGIHELYLLFYIAAKYRDYLEASPTIIMRGKHSVKFIIDKLKGAIEDGPRSIKIDFMRDNPFFDLTHTKTRYWKWDSINKKYIITNKAPANDNEQNYSNYELDGMTLNLGDRKVNIAHISIRDKDPWSLIKKGIRKGTSEHTDYTGIKIVLPEESLEDPENVANAVFNYFLKEFGDGITWLEAPKKEPLVGNLSKRKDIVVWKGILRTYINGVAYPLEIQIYGNETTYLFSDIDSKSPRYHGVYKLGQLEELLTEFFPHNLYGEVKTKDLPERRKLNGNGHGLNNL